MLNRPFEGERPDPSPDREPAPKPARGRYAWLLVIPLVLIAVALYAFLSREEPAPPATAPAPVAIAPPDPEKVAEVADQQAAHVLRAQGEGTDEKLRAELGTLSADAAWQAWLAATPDLMESAAVIIANVADDDDPRRRMVPLRPTSRFEVVEQGGHTFQSQEGMRRYDAAANVLASLDAHALAPLWRTLHPLVSIAYRAIGRPGVSLDQAADRALKRISDAHIPDQPAPLQLVGKLWLYTEPDLEQQGALEKILLRLGPANARKLQAKALELRQALELP